ncbi:MAG TPA: MFS transporter [Acidimicrobiia bacterium]|nr:MFS transporter [Acidimicrobiia bacterium]
MPARFGFGAILAVVMGVATFALTVFGVLTSQLIDEFGIARWQVGALVTASSAAGAILSPTIGRLTDRFGGRRSALVNLGLGTLALAALALAPTFGLLVIAALVTGIAQGMANPATNKLISLHVPAGSRGLITGIKQSGVQVGTVLGGLALPLLALAWGWRWAVATFAGLAAIGLISAFVIVPHDPGRGTSEVTREKGVPADIIRLAGYGFLLGAGGSALFTYTALYGQETLGYSPAAAGAAVALMGVVGVVSRIAWSHAAERGHRYRGSLVWLAALSAVAALLMAAAPAFPPLVWLAAATTGLSASAWNSVGMLAIIFMVPATSAGRASGVVLFGFLAGLGLGAPVFGWSVDALGTYLPGWLTAAGLFGAGWIVALTLPRTNG